MIGISARSSEELQAVILSVHAAPKAVQANIKKYAAQDIVPAWTDELAQQGADALQQRLLVDTGRASVTNSTIRLRSGGINAQVSGGLSTDTVSKSNRGGVYHSYKAAEFGANQFLVKEITSPNGRPEKRRTQAQFKRHDNKGYVVYPAARKVIPRIASLWVATVVRTLHDAFEGKLS
jgi:hypothetical protein